VSSDSFEVPFTRDELQKMLKQQLTGPFKDLLAEAIIGLIHDKKELGLLTKASLGVRPDPLRTMYMEYYVKESNVSLYSADKIAMQDKGIIREDGRMLCKLVGFNPWTGDGYEIEYSIITFDGKQELRRYSVYESSLQGTERKDY
jgi:hypothetical protein